jgi:hypothetical protein
MLDTLAKIGIGGLTGLADSKQKKGYYVPMFNWAGNGVARGGIQYLANPNYRDYASGGRMLSSLFGGDEEEGGDTFKALGERLNTMLSKPMFQQDTIYNYPLNTQEYTMPSVAGVGGNTIGGTNGAYDSMYYGLPTKGYTKPNWLK